MSVRVSIVWGFLFAGFEDASVSAGDSKRRAGRERLRIVHLAEALRVVLLLRVGIGAGIEYQKQRARLFIHGSDVYSPNWLQRIYKVMPACTKPIFRTALHLFDPIAIL